VVGSSAAGSSWSPQETKPKGSKIAAANGSIVVSFIGLIFNFDRLYTKLERPATTKTYAHA
jgi:hypothetical protein